MLARGDGPTVASVSVPVSVRAVRRGVVVHARRGPGDPDGQRDGPVVGITLVAGAHVHCAHGPRHVGRLRGAGEVRRVTQVGRQGGTVRPGFEVGGEVTLSQTGGRPPTVGVRGGGRFGLCRGTATRAEPGGDPSVGGQDDQHPQERGPQAGDGRVAEAPLGGRGAVPGASVGEPGQQAGPPVAVRPVPVPAGPSVVTALPGPVLTVPAAAVAVPAPVRTPPPGPPGLPGHVEQVVEDVVVVVVRVVEEVLELVRALAVLVGADALGCGACRGRPGGELAGGFRPGLEGRSTVQVPAPPVRRWGCRSVTPGQAAATGRGRIPVAVRLSGLSLRHRRFLVRRPSSH
jgi:hypothetical protein